MYKRRFQAVGTNRSCFDCIFRRMFNRCQGVWEITRQQVCQNREILILGSTILQNICRSHQIAIVIRNIYYNLLRIASVFFLNQCCRYRMNKIAMHCIYADIVNYRPELRSSVLIVGPIEHQLIYSVRIVRRQYHGCVFPRRLIGIGRHHYPIYVRNSLTIRQQIYTQVVITIPSDFVIKRKEEIICLSKEYCRAYGITSCRSGSGVGSTYAVVIAYIQCSSACYQLAVLICCIVCSITDCPNIDIRSHKGKSVFFFCNIKVLNVRQQFCRERKADRNRASVKSSLTRLFHCKGISSSGSKTRNYYRQICTLFDG